MCRPFKVFESLELENQVEPISRARNTTIVFHLTCCCLIKKMVMEKKSFFGRQNPTTTTNNLLVELVKQFAFNNLPTFLSVGSTQFDWIISTEKKTLFIHSGYYYDTEKEERK